MSDDLMKATRQLHKELQAMAALHEKLDADLLRTGQAVLKKPPPRLVFEGLVQAYMAVIKACSGLTSARPATVKAIQTAEKSPSISAIGQAVAEMKKHLAEVEKTSKKDKAFAPFKKGLEGVIEKTEALLG